jgi:hypothetical protein
MDNIMITRDYPVLASLLLEDKRNQVDGSPLMGSLFLEDKMNFARVGERV